MANKKRFKATEVAKAIQDTKGFVSKAADLLGCHVTTVYNYIDEYAIVKDAVTESRERRHDFVENQLMGQINEGNVTAIIFYLKTQAKSRGYIERVEVEHDGAVNLGWGDNAPIDD